MFMEDMNILLNDQTEQQLAECQKKSAKKLAKRSVQATPRDEAIALAMELSL